MDYIWNLVVNHLGDIVSFIVGIGIITPFLLKAKNLVKKAAKLITDIDTILDDNTISNDEIIKVKQDALDIWLEIKSWTKKQ